MPAHTSITSPAVAALIAACIVEYEDDAVVLVTDKLDTVALPVDVHPLSSVTVTV